jgi:hypothetical protein
LLIRHHDSAAHVGTDRADIVERTALVEAVTKGVIGVEHFRVHVQRGKVYGMGDVFPVLPYYARASRDYKGGRREGKVVDHNLGIGCRGIPAGSGKKQATRDDSAQQLASGHGERHIGCWHRRCP